MAEPLSFPQGELGYGQRVQRSLPALHRGFLAVNRYFATPALRAGLGGLFSTPIGGYLLLLRTKGRTSGEVREAPLGYVITDGAVYCVAGFGRRTHWFRNIEADPRVEVVLPGRSFAGLAEEVTDQAEYLSKMRTLLAALGLVGRETVRSADGIGRRAAGADPRPSARPRPRDRDRGRPVGPRRAGLDSRAARGDLAELARRPLGRRVLPVVPPSRGAVLPPLTCERGFGGVSVPTAPGIGATLPPDGPIAYPGPGAEMS